MNSSSMADPTSMSNSKDQYQTLNNSSNGGQSNDSFDSILSNTESKQIKTKIIHSGQNNPIGLPTSEQRMAN